MERGLLVRGINFKMESTRRDMYCSVNQMTRTNRQENNHRWINNPEIKKAILQKKRICLMTLLVFRKKSCKYLLLYFSEEGNIKNVRFKVPKTDYQDTHLVYQ